MKNKVDLAAIAGTVVENKQNLQDLKFRISNLENQIAKVASSLSKYHQDAKILPAISIKTPQSGMAVRKASNIIPFPGTNRQKPEKKPHPFLCRPGTPVPPQLTDFRPVLQRHGLILLGWDIRISEKG